MAILVWRVRPTRQARIKKILFIKKIKILQRYISHAITAIKPLEGEAA